MQRTLDVAVGPSAHDKAVVVGVWMFKWRGDDWSGMTWRCHTRGCGRIGQLCTGLSIAKSWPRESGRGGVGVLPANLIEILLEFGMLCLGNGACSYVACLIVAVNEAFTVYVPAGTHEEGVVPLGAISRAFSCEFSPLVFAFLY